MKRIFYTKLAILKRKLYEDFYSFGFSVSLATGLLIGGLSVRGFLRSISIIGLSSSSPDPLYKMLINLLELLFGKESVYKVVSYGPFLVSLFFSFIPVIFFLIIHSTKIFFINYTKKYIISGFSDIKTYLMISLVKRILLIIFALIVIWLYFIFLAFLNNLSINTWFLSFIFVLVFFSISLFCIQTFISVLVQSTHSVILFFLLFSGFFILIQTGFLAFVRLNDIPLFSVAVSIIRWISPINYLSIGLSSNISNVLSSIGFQSIFSILIVALSFLIIRMREIRFE